jgi:hypothetical protein
MAVWRVEEKENISRLWRHNHVWRNRNQRRQWLAALWWQAVGRNSGANLAAANESSMKGNMA